MSEPGAGLDHAQIEAIVRTYLGRMARRYSPFIAALVVLLLIALLLPSRSQNSNLTNGNGNNNGSSTQGDNSGVGANGPLASSGPGGTGSSTASGGSSGGGSSGISGGPITAPAAAGTRGITRSGIECGPGVKQVKWTVYAPPCIPKYSGYNGGTRYRGVTKDKIIAYYRVDHSAQDTAVNAALGKANLDDNNYIADLKVYLNYFNKQFELYGRQVQLFTYTGKGDYLNEDQGLDNGQAAADAQTAYDNNGFIDATFPLKGSYPFWQALADRKMVTLDPVGFPQKWYEERQPYWYSALPTGTGTANWVINMVCQRMAGMKASFAGDSIYKVKNRVFGLVHPDNPEYKDIGTYIKSQLKSRCGVDLTGKEISYTLNVAEMGQEATSVSAQMKAANVSTVLCYCDPIFPITLTNAADGQNYHPEWWSPGWGDAQAQDLPKDQWNHAVVIGAPYPPKSQDEAYKVFKLASPHTEPQSPYYAVAYGILLLMYDALQTTGPNLNPSTFQKGWFGMGTISGPAGTLEWAPQHYSPIVSAPMSWFDFGQTSNFNGSAGAYRACSADKFLPFDLSKASEWGSGQVSCFK
jgi:hypothetical protein